MVDEILHLSTEARYTRGVIAYIDELKNADLSQETAVVRTGFDIKRGENLYRLTETIETINFLRKRGAKVVMISHRGRPRGDEQKYSLAPFIAFLEEKLHTEVYFFSQLRFKKIRRAVANEKPGSVFLLENLRFLPGEQKNDRALAKQLASLGTFFVNEAFSVSHRDASSLVAITQYLPSFGGLLLKHEIENLSRVSKKQKKPFVVVLGGTKITDKIDLLQRFIKTTDRILVGGAAANAFLVLFGVLLGPSYIEKDALPIASKLISSPYGKKIVVPVDWKRDQNGAIKDIGEKSIRLFSTHIAKARTIIWNGPMGRLEDPQFRKGSLRVARAIARSRAFSVVGGGETAEFSASLGLQNKFEFLSTGGGAMLQYLGGNHLPGLIALEKSYAKSRNFISR